ncbi:MAG: amidohydrolase family protein [Bryobacteraceae bacterium]
MDSGGHVLLVRGARQLLTLHGAQGPRRGPGMREIGLIADGAVLLRDGVIEEVGPSRRVENLASAHGAEEIDATGRVVMPGFVDSHTHLVHAGAPADGAPVDPTHLIHTTSARRLELRARATLAGMARHGTTTLEAKTGHGCDEAAQQKILRVLAAVNGDPLDVVPALMACPPHALSPAWVRRMAQRGLAVFADIPACDPNAGTLISAAREAGLKLKAHGALPATGMGWVTVDHLDVLSDDGVRVLANSDAIATLLPCEDFGAPKPLPARALIDAGAAVALATGFDPRAIPVYSMQMALALAARAGMTAAEAVCAATINGAWALGRGQMTGSLEPGKQADLIVLNVPDYREAVHYFGINLVHMTVKKGAVIYREGAVA